MRDDLTIKGDVIDVAASVVDPSTGKDLLDAHILESVEVNGGVVDIRLVFEPGTDKDVRWGIEDGLTESVEKIDGVKEVRVSGFVRGQEAAAPAAAAEPSGAPAAAAAPTPAAQPKTVEGVGRVIAVASGKGGVGKSTVAVNLALALRRLGYRVGLLDIDIYGPSLPTLLGINDRPNVRDKRIVPLETQGLKLMSLGFLMEDDTPVIWRGPIVTGIIRQFLQDVDWSGTDYLVVDMPPGTGDAQLSLAQTVPVDGAVVVTTPSDLALVDAARGLKMFQTLNVDVIGIVENMAWFAWPGLELVRKAANTLRGKGANDALSLLDEAIEKHGKTWIFGQGGGRREADRLGARFLGEIPLDGNVRKSGDEGKPIVVAEPDGPVAEAFLDLARRVAEAKPIDASTGEGARKKGLFSFLRS